MREVYALELHSLRLIVLVHDLGSVGSAASVMGLSQPQASRLLQKAERALGLRLFSRSPRGAAPTEAGEALIPLAKGVLAGVAELGEAAERRRRGEAGSLRVGYTSLAAVTVLPAFARCVRCALPEYRLCLELAGDARLERMLIEGDLDLALLHPPTLSASLRTHRLWFDPMALVVPEDFPFSGEDASLAEAAQYPMLLPSASSWPTTLRDLYDRCRSEGVEPDVRESVDDPYGRIALVASGHGVTLTSQARAKALVEGVRFLCLRGHEDFGFETALAYPSRRRAAWLASVLEACRDGFPGRD